MIIFKRTPENMIGSRTKDDIEIEMKMSNENTWPEVIDNLLSFLRACGYVIPEGNYELINTDEKNDPIETSEDFSCGPSYCMDCSCGKKEKALSSEEEIS